MICTVISRVNRCRGECAYRLERLTAVLTGRSSNVVSISGSHQTEELQKRLLHCAWVCENDLHEASERMALLVVPGDLADRAQKCGRYLSKMH